MSSFVVDYGTVDLIIKGYELINKNKDNLNLNNLGKEIYDLNLRAYSERYNLTENDEEYKLIVMLTRHWRGTWKDSINFCKNLL